MEGDVASMCKTIEGGSTSVVPSEAVRARCFNSRETQKAQKTQKDAENNNSI
jgi:hypothetical protein